MALVKAAFPFAASPFSRSRLALAPLGRVEEETPAQTFGVRSYLHNFYDDQVYKDPSVYEDELRFLFSDAHARRSRWPRVFCRIFFWFGVALMILGVAGLFVGLLVPRRNVVVEKRGENIYVVDHDASTFNSYLSACTFLGSAIFCFGSMSVIASFVVPAFYGYRCPGDIWRSSEEGGGTRYVAIGESAPRSPVDKNVPATGQLTAVQPNRKPHESVVTKNGLVEYE